MSKLIKKSKGFTLLELMVVMALLTVLMGMTFTAMTGVKGSAIESTAQTDANNTQKSTDKFNNQSIKYGVFPEETTIAGAYNNSEGAVAFKDKNGVSKTVNDTTHSAIKWDATVKVWLKDGSVETQTFVPHYMQKQPESVPLINDENSTDNKNEFLWLLKKESTGSAASSESSRKVEVYRLKPDSGSVAYFQIY